MIHSMVKRALKAQAGTLEDAAQLRTIATHVRAAEPGAPELTPLSDHIAELKKLVDEKTGTAPIDTTRRYGGLAAGGQGPGVPDPRATPAGGADAPAGEPAANIPTAAPSAPLPQQGGGDGGGNGGSGGNGGGNGIAAALEAITAYIPAEILGAYITLSALFVPANEDETALAVKWTIFGVAMILIPLLAMLSHRIVKKEQNLPDDFKFGPTRVVGLILLPALAFTVWAATLPDTPFLVFSPFVNKIAAGAVFVLAIIMPQLAKAFDLETPNGS